MRLCREFYFDAAHYIPHYKGKCENMHGHTYKLEIVVEGDIKKDGMIIDFSKLKEIIDREVLEKLDHHDLNTIVENPTAEHIVNWISEKLQGKIPVCSIKLWEGSGKWVEKIVSQL